MEWKKCFDSEVLCITDFVLGIIAFSFQIAFLSSYGITTSYDQASTGIWGGLIFIGTAVLVWTAGHDRINVDKKLLFCAIFLSFVCGIILFALTASALSVYNKLCPFYYTQNKKYWCSTEIGLDVILMLTGLAAIFVNAVLFYNVCKDLRAS